MKKLFLAVVISVMSITTVSAQEDKIIVPTVQTDKDNKYDGNTVAHCGIKFNIQLSGVTKVELESVDGNKLAGEASLKKDQGVVIMDQITNASTIITFNSNDKSGFTPGKEYYIFTLPCNLYGGYRLSFYRNGLVAHYFGVHQVVEWGTFITPIDLKESELVFDKPDAPLVEEGRPKMDSKTHDLFVQYRRNPTDANRQALLHQMEIRYDKVIARKKNKLRELEREAKTYDVVEHMQGIVSEMIQNREPVFNNSFSVSLILERMRILMILGWCCVEHRLQMPT